MASFFQDSWLLVDPGYARRTDGASPFEMGGGVRVSACRHSLLLILAFEVDEEVLTQAML